MLLKSYSASARTFCSPLVCWKKTIIIIIIIIISILNFAHFFTIQWLPVVQGLHSLSCIAKFNTRDLFAMKNILRKNRKPIFNKIIKFSNSITYFRNRTMLFCNLFIYHLPPSVILSVKKIHSEI